MKSDTRTFSEIASIVNYLYPVTSVKSFPNGALMVSRSSRYPPIAPNKKPGQNITRLTPKSLSKLAFTVMVNTQKFRSLITLTYGMDYPINGKRVKQDLNRFRLAFQREFGEMSYVWFLEFQKRGAPHVHIFSSLADIKLGHRSRLAHLWIKSQRRDDVPYSSLRSRKVMMTMSQCKLFHVKQLEVWEDLKSADGATRYAMKYASKQRQKKVPECYQNVGRFWSCSRDCSNPDFVEIEADEPAIRDAIKAIRPDVANWPLLPKLIFT